MKIKELEELTKIPRATIRYYEKEGLLSPEREENGYREYSEEDREQLLKIKLLRLLGIPLEDIKLLKEEKLEMGPVLEKQLRSLGREEKELLNSQRVCREIRDDRVTYSSMDADRYIASYREGPPETWKSEETLYQRDVIPPVQAPIRRYLARSLDLFFCSLLWDLFMINVCNVNIANHRILSSVLIPAFGMLTLLLFEPLLLRLFGTTLGKWILGLRVTYEEGNRLSYRNGLERTWKVLLRGMGLQIPVYAWIRLWKSMKACSDGDRLEWEGGSVLDLKDEKNYRGFIYAGVLLASFGLLFLSFYSANMPKHRGAVTVAEFSENYNRMAGWNEYDFNATLNSDGEWVKDEYWVDSPTFSVLAPEESYLPKYEYSVDGEEVKSVRFDYRTEADYPASCMVHMLLAARAFACTDKDFGILGTAWKELQETIVSHYFEGFQYASDGITVDCQVEKNGYDRTALGLSPAEKGVPQSFHMVFSITKE